jgi:Skp family chaperone for outer membrane proteins
MMKKSHFLTVLSMIGLVASVSSSATAAQPAIYPVDTSEIRAAARNATTRSDHEAVAKYYEDAATQMQAKVKEQKELLEQYQDKSYLYGRQAQDLQSHTEALVRNYEQAATTNIQEAALHRQMASKLEENHAASGTQRLSAVDGLHRNSATPQ